MSKALLSDMSLASVGPLRTSATHNAILLGKSSYLHSAHKFVFPRAIDFQISNCEVIKMIFHNVKRYDFL